MRRPPPPVAILLSQYLIVPSGRGLPALPPSGELWPWVGTEGQGRERASPAAQNATASNWIGTSGCLVKMMGCSVGGFGG